MNRHVVLLGDMKGTKAHLQDYLSGRSQEIETRISELRRAFSQTVLSHMDASRSMRASVFSDSVLVQWHDPIEGARVVLPMALDLYRRVESVGIPFRLFADSGYAVPSTDTMGEAMVTGTGRYQVVMPVSLAVWAVFLAEASHFPNGIFLGADLINSMRSRPPVSDGDVIRAGPFEFRQCKSGDSQQPDRTRLR